MLIYFACNISRVSVTTLVLILLFQQIDGRIPVLLHLMSVILHIYSLAFIPQIKILLSPITGDA